MHLPPQETWVRFLVQDDALEKEGATHSSVLARDVPQTEKLQSLGSQRVKHDLATERNSKHMLTELWEHVKSTQEPE